MTIRCCVFCGSSSGSSKIYIEAATRIGQLIAERGHELVYGGGKVGLMGVVADACLASGGRVIGVIPQYLVDKEVSHSGLTDLRVVDSMHERKALMADLSDYFLCLPGGYGTWEEFFEVVTWSQLGLHRKPVGLLNINHFYDPLLSLTDNSVTEGFVRKEHRDLFLTSNDPAQLLDQLRSYSVPEIDKWS